MMRQHERKLVRVRGWIRLKSGSLVECFVEDISAGGAKLTFKHFEPPETFALCFAPGAPNHRNCTVRWRKLDSVGVAFSESMYPGFRATDR
jgi:hypothetical protein